MKHIFPFICILLLHLSAKADVIGKVLDITDSEETPKPVPQLQLSLIYEGADTSTDHRGVFRWNKEVFGLGRQHKLAGSPIEFTISASNQYIIYSPWNGKGIIPSSGNMLEVILVRKGSKKILTPFGIKKLIKTIASESTKRVNSETSPDQADFTKYYESLAKQNGFTALEIKEKIEEWSKNTLQNSEASKEDRAHAHFALKNFRDSATLFDQVLDEAEALEKHKREVSEIIRKMKTENLERFQYK